MTAALAGIASAAVAKTVPQVRWQKKTKWIVDGKFYNASGITAGMDMALGFIADRLRLLLSTVGLTIPTTIRLANKKFAESSSTFLTRLGFEESRHAAKEKRHDVFFKPIPSSSSRSKPTATPRHRPQP